MIHLFGILQSLSFFSSSFRGCRLFFCRRLLCCFNRFFSNCFLFCRTGLGSFLLCRLFRFLPGSGKFRSRLSCCADSFFCSLFGSCRFDTVLGSLARLRSSFLPGLSFFSTDVSRNCCCCCYSGYISLEHICLRNSFLCHFRNFFFLGRQSGRLSRSCILSAFVYSISGFLFTLFNNFDHAGNIFSGNPFHLDRRSGTIQ